MKNLFYLLFTILISIGTLHAELMEVNGKEASDFQDSAFIKLMSTLNNGKIPYPFSQLLDSFGLGIREEGNVLFVPKGRSLVKEHADYHNPRIIVEAISEGTNAEKLPIDSEGKLSSEFKNPLKKVWNENRDKINKMGINGGDLYIGFAPNHKALEIISYNPKKPGYDFFIVEDYEEGKTPKIINNPAQCLTCHQNEAPLFPKVPWHEMLGESAEELLKDRIELSNDNKNKLMDLIREANPEREEIEGININNSKGRFNFTQAAVFDTAVRGSNQLIEFNKSCEVLCSKGDIKCQQNLILASLSKSPNYSKYPFWQNIEKKINKMDLKSSVIVDRDPATNKGFSEIVSADYIDHNIKASVSKAKTPEEIASLTQNDEMKKEIILKYGILKNYDFTYNEGVVGFTFSLPPSIPSSNDALNPAFIRPTNSNILMLKSLIKEAKTLNDKIAIMVDKCLDLESMKKSQLNESLTPEILNRKEVLSALENWPDTNHLTESLLKVIAAKKSDDTIVCKNDPTPVIPVYKYSNLQKAAEKLSSETIKKPTALLNRYCIQCHGNSPSTFIRLPLESLEKMANYTPTFSDKGPIERLEKKIMPPSFAELQPTEHERSEMIKALKELKK